jgi:NADPH:quinone reductase-like Zn-dependent oxidoreductase
VEEVKMKAIILSKYGTPQDLDYREVATPEPRANQILVRIYASAINDWELGLIAGEPFFMRMFLGFTRPKLRIIGCDVAGRVESIGAQITRFKQGDEVYGDLSGARFGAFAEHVCVPEDAIELKPRNVSFDEAAALPHAGCLALQGLRDLGRLDAGQSVLINGAGGGVGAVGIPYAKLYGAHVTGVDSGRKIDFMLSLGCDEVIDYTQTDFTKSGRQYDLILDTKTSRSPFSHAKALKPGGSYVTVGGSMPRIVQMLLMGWWIKHLGNKHMKLLGLKPNRGLKDITELVETGAVTPRVGEVFPLQNVVQALDTFAASTHTGKIVLSIP